MVILDPADVNAAQEASMQVRVDEERCQGHGLCRLSAPDIFFAREEDGHAYVLSETVPEGREDEAQLAADSCPELAIEVE
jgi:ferredoxin